MPTTTCDYSTVIRRALQFNTPLTAIMENHHNGYLPLSYEGISISKANIVLSAFKKAEDGNGYIIRAYECDGKSTSCKLDCKKLGVYDVDFTPYEAKTLRIHNGVVREVLFTEYDMTDN